MIYLEKLKELNNSLDERLDWNDYFMSIALLASNRSPCTRLKVGCVIVKNNVILSTGYNGFLPGNDHISIVIDNHEQATVHAEQNAISHAAKNGISIMNSQAYITHYPCLNCFKSLISAGITEIFYLDNYKNNSIIKKLNDSNRITICQLNIKHKLDTKKCYPINQSNYNENSNLSLNVEKIFVPIDKELGGEFDFDDVSFSDDESQLSRSPARESSSLYRMYKNFKLKENEKKKIKSTIENQISKSLPDYLISKPIPIKNSFSNQFKF